jgi:Protein of unknown function (DUF1064)
MKPSKYKNIKTIMDGIKFDSLKESRRYAELKLLEKAGEIEALELQKPFVLCGSVVLNGRRKPPVKYIADFCYRVQDKGEYYQFVEDVKSARTRKLPVYRLKIHLLKSIHDITVIEI